MEGGRYIWEGEGALSLPSGGQIQCEMTLCCFGYLTDNPAPPSPLPLPAMGKGRKGDLEKGGQKVQSPDLGVFSLFL